MILRLLEKVPGDHGERVILQSGIQVAPVGSSFVLEESWCRTHSRFPWRRERCERVNPQRLPQTYQGAYDIDLFFKVPRPVADRSVEVRLGARLRDGPKSEHSIRLSAE